MRLLIHLPTNSIASFEINLEQFLLIFLSDPNPIVSDRNPDSNVVLLLCRVLFSFHTDFLPTITKLDRVLNQINQYLLAAHSVDEHVNVSLILEPIERKLNALCICLES